jgi:leader peptidase (prepilin peptidase)/N-methyltransferase
VTYVLVGAIGFLIGLAAHDLGVQSLRGDLPLRPFAGTCPTCAENRGWLRFRCPSCGRGVSREPVLALITTLVALAFANTVGLTWELVAYLAFLLLSSALIVTDLEAFRITDRLNLRGSVALALILGGAAMIESNLGALLRGLGGAAAYFVGASLVFMLVRGRGFGAGDVKLAPQLGMITAYLGWSVLGWAVFATALIGGAVALALVVSGAAGRKTELPYGPPMVIGAWAAIAMVGVGAIPVPS